MKRRRRAVRFAYRDRRGIPWPAIAVALSLAGNVVGLTKLWVDMEHRFTVLEKDVGFIKGALKIKEIEP